MKGLFLLVSLSTYFRPCEMFSLKKKSLVRPALGVMSCWSVIAMGSDEKRVSKTGDQDLGVMLDSKWLRWVTGPLESLKQGNPEDPLWTFTYAEYLVEFKACARLINDEQLSPYHARHSGASADRADGSRSLGEIMKRGFWRAKSSVARYEKSAKLAQALDRYDWEIVEYMKRCESALEDTFLRARPVPAPPASVVRLGGMI